jgi:RecA-family ATPase
MSRRNNLSKPSAYCALEEPLPPWVWQGYLAPGAVTVLTAGYKIGKSTLLTLLLDTLREGGTLAGEPVLKGRVLVGSEEPKRAWLPRFKKFDLEGHSQIDIRPFPISPSEAEWCDYVDSYLDTPADLCVFDSLVHFSPAGAEYTSDGVRRTLAPLRRLTEAGRSVAITHQPAKGRGGDFNFRGFGSIEGDPEVLMELKLPKDAGPDDRRRILHVRSRLDYVPPRRMLRLNPEGNSLAVVT